MSDDTCWIADKYRDGCERAKAMTYEYWLVRLNHGDGRVEYISASAGSRLLPITSKRRVMAYRFEFVCEARYEADLRRSGGVTAKVVHVRVTVRRSPPSPAVLANAKQDRITPTSGRLIAARKVKP